MFMAGCIYTFRFRSLICKTSEISTMHHQTMHIFFCFQPAPSSPPSPTPTPTPGAQLGKRDLRQQLRGETYEKRKRNEVNLALTLSTYCVTQFSFWSHQFGHTSFYHH